MMSYRDFALVGLLALLVAISTRSYAANLQLLVIDSADSGFNDTTVVQPVAGNHASTLGEQRLAVFEFAARLWETILVSDVTIAIEASFASLSCDAGSAVLGSAGPKSIHWNFSNAPIDNTLYVQAQANSLAGFDVNSKPDIGITFNSAIDNNNNCLANTNWYYGLDGDPPDGTVELLPVVLHEIAHGLGFITFVDLITGARLSNVNDGYMRLLQDHSLGMNWHQLNDSQRQASATDDGDLHWSGSFVNQAANDSATGLSSGLVDGQVRMYAPAELNEGSSVSHFDTVLGPNELMEPYATGPKTSVGLAKPLLQDLGWRVNANDQPIMAGLPDVTVVEDGQRQIPLLLLDNNHNAEQLVIQLSSNNPSLIAEADMAVTGNGFHRSLVLTPKTGASGSASITVTVSDGELSDTEVFQLEVIANAQPVISILSPADGTQASMLPVTLQAQASDAEDGDLNAAVIWTSDIDGHLATGSVANVSLSDAEHIISASVTDSNGKQAQAVITLTIALDSDGDGLSDVIEAQLGTRIDRIDTDEDGVSDYDEVNRDADPSRYQPGVDTDPGNPDTDGDGIIDGQDAEPLQAAVYHPIDEDIFLLPPWAVLLFAGILALHAQVGSLVLRLRKLFNR